MHSSICYVFFNIWFMIFGYKKSHEKASWLGFCLQWEVYLVISRAMTNFCISLVPSPMVQSLESR